MRHNNPCVEPPHLSAWEAWAVRFAPPPALAVWDASVSEPYDWVVSLDLDAAFNDPKTSIEQWLKQGISMRSRGGGGRGRAGTRAVALSQIVDDACSTSHHGGNDLASGCVVVGKDLHGVAGVNGGVSFVRRSQQALGLLSAWWSWVRVRVRVSKPRPVAGAPVVGGLCAGRDGGKR